MEILMWRNILDPYDLAVKELTTKFKHIQYEHKARGIYCPIESVQGRVKTVSSILDKMQKKQINFSDLEERMEDIAGVRIICQFVEDIPKVVHMIHQRQDMKIINEKNYVDHMKSSGYRSYHLIVEYVVHTMNGPKQIQAEIQVRTMGMNFWSTIEHSLQYKYKHSIPDHLTEKLLRASDAIGLLDQVMSQVREEIMDAQNSMQLQANLISEILTNIQNLYKVANKDEISKIQEEFYEVYQQNDLEKLELFHKQLDIISDGYRAQSIQFQAEDVT